MRTLPKLVITNLVETVSPLITGRSEEIANGPSGFSSESNNSVENNLLSNTSTVANSIVYIDESKIDIVVQVTCSVTPAAGCSSNDLGTFTCIKRGKYCNLLRGSKVNSEDSELPI